MPGRKNPYSNAPTRRLHLPVSFAVVCTLFLLTGCKGPHKQGVVYKKGQGLNYIEDQFGNHIPDYSTAGYQNGSPLPSVPTIITLDPSPREQDDTQRIQQAIDQLAKQDPNQDGSRGAILLKAGEYRVEDRLSISASGIVLRGEGQFEGGTTLQATGNQRRSLIVVSGNDPEQSAFNRMEGGNFRYRPRSGETWEVVDEYVPSGHNVVQVSPVRGLAEGDTVILEQRMNQEWIRILGMDAFPPRPDGEQSTPWDPLDFVFQFERRITHIDGGRVHLDAPLMNPIFSRFGKNSLFKANMPDRVKESGVEHLRLESAFNSTGNQRDENHAWDGVEMGLAQDCWVKGVTAVHFGQSAVKVLSGAIRITVEDCAYLDPVAQEGYGRRHGFINAGQQVLIQRSFAEACSYPFFIPDRTCGPNVFLDCYAEGDKSVIGPWRFWAMGTLWDNVHGQALMIRNRGYDGNGWGWSGINHLFWNSTAFDWISVQSPINGWNWAIGSQGRRIAAPFQGLTGHFSSHEKPKTPRSLFMEQLKERKGSQAAATVFTTNQESGTVYVHIRDTLSEN